MKADLLQRRDTHKRARSLKVQHAGYSANKNSTGIRILTGQSTPIFAAKRANPGPNGDTIVIGNPLGIVNSNNDFIGTGTARSDFAESPNDERVYTTLVETSPDAIVLLAPDKEWAEREGTRRKQEWVAA